MDRPILSVPATYSASAICIGLLLVIIGLALVVFGAISFAIFLPDAVADLEKTTIFQVINVMCSALVLGCGALCLGVAGALHLLADTRRSTAATAMLVGAIYDRPQTSSAAVSAKEPQYLYRHCGEIRGPVSLATLKDMRAFPDKEERLITGETMVCLCGTGVWHRLAEV